MAIDWYVVINPYTRMCTYAVMGNIPKIYIDTHYICMYEYEYIIDITWKTSHALVIES